MKVNKQWLIMFAAVIMIMVLAACGGGEEESSAEGGENNSDNGEEEVEESDNDNGESTDNEAAGLEGTVTSSGSTSVQPISEELGSAFMEEEPDVRVEVSGGGSGAGVTAAQDGSADFGGVSRELNEDETGVEAIPIAIDGIAIIVHPDNPVSDASLEEVTDIFTGEITNWSEVGGDEEDIVVVSREDGSGTRDAFDDIVLGDEELVDTALIQDSTGAVAETVANDEIAIGYMSTGSMDDSVKGLEIDGAEPSDENITDGEYEVARPFNYAINEDESLSEEAQGFLDFVLSDEGQQVVEDNGFISVDE